MPNKFSELNKTEVSSKKHMLERPKQFGGHPVNVSEEIVKNIDKLQSGSKFVKSAKEFASMEYFSQHKRFDKKDYNIDDVPNQEETDPSHNYHAETKSKLNNQNEFQQKGG